MTTGWPANANLTPSTSIPAGTVKNPKARSGARRSASTPGGNRISRAASAATSTTKPAQATTRNTRDSHDGPSRNAAVETIPVAITNAKQPGSRSRTALAAADIGPRFPWESVVTSAIPAPESAAGIAARRFPLPGLADGRAVDVQHRPVPVRLGLDEVEVEGLG